MIKWQSVQRLVGSDDPAWIVEHLLLDSLLFLRVLPAGIRTIADVGSGAGLPGVPLAIVRPEWSLTLVESRQRRVSFLSTAARELPLPNVRVAATRVETLATEAPRSFDAAVMRCAGDFDALAGVASALVRPGGLLVASGPPSPRPLRRGEWQEVEGLGAGSRRRFAVYQV